MNTLKSKKEEINFVEELCQCEMCYGWVNYKCNKCHKFVYPKEIRKGKSGLKDTEKKTRTLYLERKNDISGVSGTGIVADGVMFPDGICVLNWRTAGGSTAVYKGIIQLKEIHGHDGNTLVVWY